MKRKTVIALREKKKYGLLMGPFFGIKDVKEARDVDKISRKFTAILFIGLYRKPRGHNLRWRMRERARGRFCGENSRR
jgi:hypothetical protein|nr:hypothetical protein [uncultured Dialister sp.]DAP87081.1 MAG TPA: hypothetical protein [Caudoviricetes sp.]